ncbi:MAG: hypothetical protein H6582_03595 [Crocinitomicaceae bacterium]|nr:hypothetical protein [Crocinitomicaceae bacterium]
MKVFAIIGVFFCFGIHSHCQFDKFFEGYKKYVNDSSWLFSDYTYRFRNDLSLGFTGNISTNYVNKNDRNDSIYHWTMNGEKLTYCDFISKGPLNLQECFSDKFEGSKINLKLYKNNQLYLETNDSFYVSPKIRIKIFNNDSLIQHNNYKYLKEPYQYVIDPENSHFKIQLLNQSLDESEITVLNIRFTVLKSQIDSLKTGPYGMNITPPQLHLYQFPFDINRYLVIPKGIKEFEVPFELIRGIPAEKFELMVLQGKKVTYECTDGREVDVFRLSHDGMTFTLPNSKN